MKYDSGMKAFNTDIIKAVQSLIGKSELEKVKKLAADGNASLLREYLKERHGRCYHGTTVNGYKSNTPCAMHVECTLQQFKIEFNYKINNSGDYSLDFSWSQITTFIRNHINDIFTDNKDKETQKMKFDINSMIASPAAAAGAAVSVQEIPVDMLVPYSKHPFTLYSGERLDDMVQSVKNNGILTPIIVRELNGKYEILAGHNRTNAAKCAGLTTVPAVVKNISDEDAEMYVIETNAMQRGFKDLRISEQAAVVALRHSKMFNDKKAAAIREELKAIEANAEEQKPDSKLARVGEEYGLSKNTIARLIRINKLLTACREYTLAVDTNNLSIRAAVELSYIKSSEALHRIFEYYKTSIVVDNIWRDSVKIDIKLAELLREKFEDFDGDDEQAEMRLITMYHGKDTKPKKEKVFKVHSEIYGKYFKDSDTEEYVNDVISKALAQYFSM